MRVGGEYPRAIELMASGAINVKPLITAVAPLEEGPEWFKRLHAREPGLTKVVLTPGEDRMSDSLFDLKGQSAIVTGTSRGLGQYFARALAKAGADLVLTSRNRESLVPFEKEIKSLGRAVISLELDVRDQQSIERMVEAAEAAFGHLEILVNNAGCNVRKPALDVTWDDWNLNPRYQFARKFLRSAGSCASHDPTAATAASSILAP